MPAQQSVYTFPHKSLSHPSLTRFRSLRKKRRIRKRARDILEGKVNTYSFNRVNFLSIVGLIGVFMVLFYLGPTS